MKITRHMRDFARAVGARIVREEWGLALSYDPHGSVYFDSEAQFLSDIEAYRGTHPEYQNALKIYQDATK